jgi:NTE family protein
LVRNLPVDVARGMGAEVIIAVNLGTPLMKPEDIRSLLSVSFQMINLLTEQNVNRSLSELRDMDVLIVPELGNFAAGDFDNLPATVPIGEAAARKVAEKLKRYSLPPEEYAALRRQQSVAQDPPNPPLDAIVIEGNKRVNSEVILASMETKVGEPLDQNTVDLDMRRIYGRGDFESVRPDVRIKDGEETLIVKVAEKPWGPNYARFGLELEADLGKQARFNLLASFRSTWLNRLGGEWRNDIALGSSGLIDSRFYQPLDERQYFFVEPRIAYANLPFDIYLDSQRVAEYRDQAWGGGFDFGINFAAYGEARVGLIAGRRSFTIESGSPVLPVREGFSVGTARAAITIDQLDSVSFTRSGYFFGAEARVSRQELGATDNFDRIEAEGRTAFSFGRHALQFAMRGGGSVGDDPLPGYAQFQLGGFLNMSGYAQGQLIGPRYIYGRIGYLAKLLEIPFLEGLYSGVAIEALRMPQLISANNQGLFASATIYAAVDTPLGVLYLGYGYADAQNSSVYLYLGKPF